MRLYYPGNFSAYSHIVKYNLTKNCAPTTIYLAVICFIYYRKMFFYHINFALNDTKIIWEKFSCLFLWSTTMLKIWHLSFKNCEKLSPHLNSLSNTIQFKMGPFDSWTKYFSDRLPLIFWSYNGNCALMIVEFWHIFYPLLKLLHPPPHWIKSCNENCAP